MRFHYLDLGDQHGFPFVFQHGLGGDVDQPTSLFLPPAGIRLLTFDFRAHGQTFPLEASAWKPACLSFDSFGDDLVALLDELALQQAIVGGISMGAGVALNVAMRYPGRVAGLVLSRPAWLDGPMPQANVTIYAQIAHLLQQYGASDGLKRFKESEVYRSIACSSPDAARSLLRQFENERALDGVERLIRLPSDRPIPRLGAAASITVPTLVLATRQDPMHPYEYGTILASSIPGATLKELTPKSICSKEQHAAEVQNALEEFLAQVLR
jgi:pimeloyl-ACP methyl ester carboxylesterase